MNQFKGWFAAMLKPDAPIAWGDLTRCILLFFISYLFFRLALFAAQLSEPAKSGSLLILAIAIIMLFVSLLAFWKWLRETSLMRIFLTLLIVYVVSVLVWGIANVDQYGLLSAVKRSAVEIFNRVPPMLTKGVDSITQYPHDFSSYYNRDRELSDSDVVIANEPVVVQNVDLVKLTASNFSVKDKVGFNQSALQQCSLDGLSAEGVYQDEAIVLEGPRVLEGKIWWRVGNSAGSAWCPGDVLVQP